MKRPIPRIALTRDEAAESLGLSLSSFERHVQPFVPMYPPRQVAPVPGGRDRALGTKQRRAHLGACRMTGLVPCPGPDTGSSDAWATLVSGKPAKAIVELPVTVEVEEGKEFVRDGKGTPHGVVERKFCNIAWDTDWHVRQQARIRELVRSTGTFRLPATSHRSIPEPQEPA